MLIFSVYLFVAGVRRLGEPLTNNPPTNLHYATDSVFERLITLRELATDMIKVRRMNTDNEEVSEINSLNLSDLGMLCGWDIYPD
jgi:hypothetical protein